MKKTSLILGAIVFLALLISLTTARAGMVQAQANAAQATANTVQSVTLLVGQCLTGLIVFIALVGGMVIGYGFHAWHTRHLPQREIGRKWFPGPNARWGRLPDTHTAQLASPIMHHEVIYTVPSPTPTPPAHALTMADLDVDLESKNDFLGNRWGF
jgi:hypothetical protein